MNRENNPPANQSPAMHQQPNVATNDGLQMNLNPNPAANENVADNEGEDTPARGDGEGVGSEITDGTAG